MSSQSRWTTFGMPVALSWTLGFLLACGGSGGGSGEPAKPALNPPVQVQAESTTTYGYFKVSWSAPSPAVDGYELEAMLGTGSNYQKVGATIPPTGTNLTVWWSYATAELTPVTFRMRSVRNGEFSSYSNVAATKFPIRPAIGFWSNYEEYYGGIRVSWTVGSSLASTFQLERAVLTNGTPGTFSKVLEGPVATTEYLDSDLREDTAYRYRISFTGNGETSPFNSSDVSPISMLAPKLVSVVPSGQGALIRWQGVSAKATELQVQRGSGIYYPNYVTIASPVLGSTEYLDSPLGSGFYSYRIVAKNETTTRHSSDFSFVTGPVGTGFALATELRTLARDIAAMSVVGGSPVYLARNSDYYSYTLTPPSGAGWPARTFYNVAAVNRSSLLIDDQARPHVLFRRSLGGYGSPQLVVHEWFDGTTWRSENLFQDTFYDGSASDGVNFTLGPGGILHAVWLQDLFKARYGTNRSGAWESTELKPAAAGTSSLGTMRVAVDSSATAYIAMTYWDKLALLTRPSGIGSFTEELVPTGTIQGGWYDPLCMQPFGGGLAISFERDNPGGGYQVLCIIKSQGQWGQPVQLGIRPNAGYAGRQLQAGTPSGRLAFGVTMQSGLQVFSLSPNGTWDSTTLANPYSVESVWMGFDAASKFWATVYGGRAMQESADVYAWYHE